MIASPVSKESLAWALRRVEDFYTVHADKEVPDKAEAVTVLRTSLGVTDELMSWFDEWVQEWLGEEVSLGDATLGFMIGLIALDREQESGA